MKKYIKIGILVLNRTDIYRNIRFPVSEVTA